MSRGEGTVNAAFRDEHQLSVLVVELKGLLERFGYLYVREVAHFDAFLSGLLVIARLLNDHELEELRLQLPQVDIALM